MIIIDSGDEAENRNPGDLIYILREEAHPVFERAGNDLVYTR